MRAALQLGKRVYLLCVASADDGKIPAEHKLGSLPVFDGMAATGAPMATKGP